MNKPKANPMSEPESVEKVMEEPVRYSQMGSAMVAGTDTFTGRPVGSWVKWADYDALRAELERVRGERDDAVRNAEIERACNIETWAPLPCGHAAQYGFTDDGGKTGHCTICRATKAEQQLEAAERQLQDARKDERERCARVCEGIVYSAGGSNEWHEGAIAARGDCVDAIRALPPIDQARQEKG